MKQSKSVTSCLLIEIFVDSHQKVRQDDFSDLADVRALGAGAPPANAPQVPSAASSPENSTGNSNVIPPARTTDKKLV